MDLTKLSNILFRMTRTKLNDDEYEYLKTVPSNVAIEIIQRQDNISEYQALSTWITYLSYAYTHKK